MRKIVVIFTFVIFQILSSAESTINIGIIHDGQGVMDSKIREIFIKEAENIVGIGKINIISEVYGEWDNNKIESLFDEMEKNNQVDVIIPLGIIGSYFSENKHGSNKTFLVPLYFGGRKQDNNDRTYTIVSNDGLNDGINDLITINKNSKINMLVSEGYINIYGENIKKIISERQNVNLITYKNSPDKVIDKIPFGESVFIVDVKEYERSKISNISEKLIKNNNPSLSLFGTYDVKEGILSGYAYENDVEKIIRKIVIALQKLDDKNELDRYGSIEITNPQLVINMETLDRLKLYLNWDITTRSQLINKEKIGKKITLKELIEGAEKRNLEIKEIKENEKIQGKEYDKSLSNYLPNVSAGVSGVVIDTKTADASLGMYKEKTVQGELNFSQLIYSEEANVNTDIQKRIIDVNKLQSELKKIDVNTEIAITYLQMLKANASLKINEDTLTTYNKNLELSLKKEKSGAINSADIYRWKSETAVAQTALIRTESMVKQASYNLFKKSNIDFDNQLICESESEIYEYIGGNGWKVSELIENEFDSRKLCNIFIDRAIKNSIELKLLDKDIEIKNRYTEFTDKNRYMPTVALQGAYTYKIYNEGGKELDLSPFSAIGINIETDKAPKSSWNIGIGVKFNIFDGNSKELDYEKSKIELNQKKIKREQAENDIKESIMSEFSNLTTEYFNIKNFETAVNALNNNYNLVNAAYLKGEADITMVLSSKNALISVKQGLAVAKYDFLISLVKIERISGELLFTDKNKELEFVSELKSKMKEKL